MRGALAPAAERHGRPRTRPTHDGGRWHILLAVAVLALGSVRSQDQTSVDGGGRQAGKATGILPQFSAWLRKHGVDDGAVRLVEEDGSGWGNGIVARKPLKEGDLLFRIPLK